MNAREDIELLAGEYVLGTLDLGERAAVAARRPREPELDRAIARWEHRMAPLDDLNGAVVPPQDLLRRIELRIRARAGTSTVAHGSAERPDALARSRRTWRAAAIGAGALAASLAVVVGGLMLTPAPRGGEYIAVLQTDGTAPAFVVALDLERQTMTVRQLAAEPPRDHSYELWLVHARLPAPRSLGVVGHQQFEMEPTDATLTRELLSEATFAVSLEPSGGSATGAPTGPVLFSGRLIATRR